jgi:hypothetical protein
MLYRYSSSTNTDRSRSPAHRAHRPLEPRRHDRPAEDEGRQQEAAVFLGAHVRGEQRDAERAKTEQQRTPRLSAREDDQPDREERQACKPQLGFDEPRHDRHALVHEGRQGEGADLVRKPPRRHHLPQFTERRGPRLEIRRVLVRTDQDEQVLAQAGDDDGGGGEQHAGTQDQARVCRNREEHERRYQCDDGEVVAGREREDRDGAEKTGDRRCDAPSQQQRDADRDQERVQRVRLGVQGRRPERLPEPERQRGGAGDHTAGADLARHHVGHRRRGRAEERRQRVHALDQRAPRQQREYVRHHHVERIARRVRCPEHTTDEGELRGVSDIDQSGIDRGEVDEEHGPAHTDSDQGIEPGVQA